MATSSKTPPIKNGQSVSRRGVTKIELLTKAAAEASPTVLRNPQSRWSLVIDGQLLVWSQMKDRIAVIRAGLPSQSVEAFSHQHQVSIKQLLQWMHLPQTTYNKKKTSGTALGPHETERILLLVELFDFGYEVFNQENEKFHRWLRKPNPALGGVTPEELLDTYTGFDEVYDLLIRIDQGIFA
jgi:putative toxin-antitoxin system antitoxin component (TIGR02293 family)